MKKFTKVRKKHLCQTLYFNTVARPRPATCKKRAPTKTFFVKFAKSFDLFKLQSNCEGLLMMLKYVKLKHIEILKIIDTLPGRGRASHNCTCAFSPAVKNKLFQKGIIYASLDVKFEAG